MGRLIFPLLAVWILISGPARSETKVDVSTMVRIAGCLEFKVAKVAELKENDERVYVAWCAALTNYLMVVKCRRGACQILEPRNDRSMKRPRTQ